MKKLIIIILATLFMCSTVLYAQSNNLIDEIIEQETLLYGHAAVLLLSAGNLIDEEASPSEALQALVRQNLLKSERSVDAAISLGEYSYILMQLFDVKGGIMYTLFPSPRYASRELGHQGYILQDSGAYRTLSGQEALSILGVFLRRGDS